MKPFGILVGLFLLVSCGKASHSGADVISIFSAPKQAIKSAGNLGDSCGISSACSSGFVCDYYFLSQQVGTCQKACNPTQANPCQSGQVCNPLNGACEPTCSGSLGSNKNNCQFLNGPDAHSGVPNSTLLGCSANSTTGFGYCYVSCAQNTDCNTNGYLPSGMVCSRGMCVPPCNQTGGCSGPGQICDYTTGSCGIGCVPGDSTCSGEQYPVTSTNGTVLIAMTQGACSPYSATCVPQCSGTACSVANTCNTVNSKGFCEVSGNSCKVPSSDPVNVSLNNTTTNNICGVLCTETNTTNCQKGQSCNSGICSFPTCQNGPNTQGTCSSGYLCNAASNGYCLSACPGGCATGLTCNVSSNTCQCTPGSCPNGQGCLNGTSCGACTASAQCALNSTCVSSSCLPSCVISDTCVTPNICIAEVCQSCTVDPTKCPAATSCKNGACVADCSGSCRSPKTCALVAGSAQCITACTSTSCSPNNLCGVGAPCTQGRACNSSGQCESCSTSNPCSLGSACINESCQSSYPGDGIPGSYTPTGGSATVCDEGSLMRTCTNSDAQCPENFVCPVAVGSTDTISLTCIPTNRCCANSDCPTGLTCQSAGNTCTLSSPIGFCGPSSNFPAAATRGNGLNGHCALDGSKICAVAVTLTTPLSPSKAWSSIPAANQFITIGAALSQVATLALTDVQCPNGYGVWVTNGTDSSETWPISVNQNVNIFGGFNGTETYISDRRAQYLVPTTPLGQNAPSGTLIKPAPSKGGFVLGTIATTCTGFSTQSACQAQAGCTWATGCTGTPTPAASITLDGFQILNGGDSAIVINSGVTANLKNLRIAGNSAIVAGGAIQNAGTMILKDSMITMNTAATQGGAISHTATTGTSTIERVAFFGNSAGSASAAVPLCAAGGTGTCPFGMTCPITGGACRGTPNITCPVNGCLPGMTCPVEGGTCTGTAALNQGGAIAAIPATGTGAPLNIYASKFNANYSYGNGGAIFSANPLTVVSSLFTGNWASNAGGGMYLSGAGASKLYNLTLIDNAAYNQGGGGIYNAVSGSTIQSSLFRNNRGLFPVNNNNLAEWGGNRTSAASGTFPLNQINSISDQVTFGPTTMSGSSGVTGSGMLTAAKYTDLCPVMAYSYNSTTPSGLSYNGICDGTEVCGQLAPALQNVYSVGPTKSPLSMSFNANATAQNTCNAVEEFVDCTSPAYRNCAPVSGKAISDAQATGGAPYSKDLAGGPLPSTGRIIRGAYQGCTDGTCLCSAAAGVCSGATPVCSNGTCIQCASNSQCSGNTPVCSNGTCVQCASNSQCSGNTPVCSNGTCVCSATAGVCSFAMPVCSGGSCIGCTANTQCVGTYPLLPVCSAGACVMCVQVSDCNIYQPQCPAPDYLACQNNTCDCIAG